MKLHAFLACWLGLVALSCADELTRTLQQKLKDQGFYYGEVDGQRSSETSAALRRYQIRYGLRVTGEADRETLRSLGLSAGSVAAGSTRSAPPMPAPSIQTSPPATTHATPPVIRRVAPPAATSRATPPMADRTPSLPSNRNAPAPPLATDQDAEHEPYQGGQDRRPQQPYGWSDRYYGDSIDRSDDNTDEPPAPGVRVSPRADSGVYSVGRTAPGSIFAGSVYERAPWQVQRNVVYTVQELLARRGFYRGEVDGLPGPATSEAIALFQRDEGLPATGQLDQETLGELHALPGQRNGPPGRDAGFTPPVPPEQQRVYRGIWINR